MTPATVADCIDTAAARLKAAGIDNPRRETRLLLAHAQTPPEPPSSRTEIPIPAELEALILCCLAKDRDQRPSSARDLLRRLDAVAFPQPWTEERARQWWHAHLREHAL